MCGIFGAIAPTAVASTLVEGLRRLEYRGYDSAGVATIEAEGLRRVCAVGRVESLAGRVAVEQPSGNIGIAHTRWATHGRPNERNSHPHMAPGVAVVHNGIVENHRALRAELAAAGCTLRSDTDTEVIPWMVARKVAEGASMEGALRATDKALEGAYAIAALHEQRSDTLYGLRRGSPLVAAVGNGCGYLASDANALAGLADRAVCLEDGDIVKVGREGLEIRNAAGAIADRRAIEVDRTSTILDLDGYAHYMLKEIYEQPRVASLINDRYFEVGILSSFLPLAASRIRRITLVACGTSYYAAGVAKRWLEGLAKIRTDVEIASEYRYRPLPPAESGELAILISQSGETADTLACLHRLKEAGCPTLALVNVVHSTLAREADSFIPLHAGIENGVASTKAFMAQLLVLARLAVDLADRRRAMLQVDVLQHLKALDQMPTTLEATLHSESAVQAMAESFRDARSALFVGRGALYPVALEGALKLKETSYIHAEGFAAGELKHGPIALIEEGMPVVALACSGELLDKTGSNIREIAARGARVTVVGDRGGILSLMDVAFGALTIPNCAEFVQPIVATVPLQLLAYHVAVQRGVDVDRPRNLAKSVTVE
ncbi:MAG: glutamine--fructose-6-phosphate transaminase (isomerizing) [Reyranellaceae bacterium]